MIYYEQYGEMRQDLYTHESDKPINDKPYPDICIRDRCRKCEHARFYYMTAPYNQYRSVLCNASIAHVCTEFLKEQEFCV